MDCTISRNGSSSYAALINHDDIEPGIECSVAIIGSPGQAVLVSLEAHSDPSSDEDDVICSDYITVDQNCKIKGTDVSAKLDEGKENLTNEILSKQCSVDNNRNIESENKINESDRKIETNENHTNAIFSKQCIAYENKKNKKPNGFKSLLNDCKLPFVDDIDLRSNESSVDKEAGENREQFNSICEDKTESITLSPPRFVRPPSDLEVLEGDDAVFECELGPEAIPSPGTGLEWFKDDDAIPPDDNDFQQTFDGRVARLSITATYVDDSAVYRCVARNEAGQDDVTAKLSVKEVPSSSEDEDEVEKKDEVIKTLPTHSHESPFSSENGAKNSKGLLADVSPINTVDTSPPARRSVMDLLISKNITSKTEKQISLNSPERIETNKQTCARTSVSKVNSSFYNCSESLFETNSKAQVKLLRGPPVFKSPLSDVIVLEGAPFYIWCEIGVANVENINRNNNYNRKCSSENLTIHSKPSSKLSNSSFPDDLPSVFSPSSDVGEASLSVSAVREAEISHSDVVSDYLKSSSNTKNVTTATHSVIPEATTASARLSSETSHPDVVVSKDIVTSADNNGLHSSKNLNSTNVTAAAPSVSAAISMTSNSDAALDDEGLLIMWYKDSELLRSGSLYQQTFDGRVAMLGIKEVYPTDEGMYECVVRNAYGKDSTTCRLRVEQKQTPNVADAEFVENKEASKVSDEKNGKAWSHELSALSVLTPKSQLGNLKSPFAYLTRTMSPETFKHANTPTYRRTSADVGIIGETSKDTTRVIEANHSPKITEEFIRIANESQKGGMKTLQLNSSADHDESETIRGIRRESIDNKPAPLETRRISDDQKREDPVQRRLRLAEEEKQRKLQEYQKKAENHLRSKIGQIASPGRISEGKDRQLNEVTISEDQSAPSISEKNRSPEKLKKIEDSRLGKVDVSSTTTDSKSKITQEIPLTENIYKVNNGSANAKVFLGLNENGVNVNQNMSNCSEMKGTRSEQLRQTALGNIGKSYSVDGETRQVTRSVGRSSSSGSDLTKKARNSSTGGPPRGMDRLVSQLDSSPSPLRVQPTASPRVVTVQRSATTVKQKLLDWCITVVKEYENVTISNFTTSWSDGMAFCALIHYFYPQAFDFSQLTPSNKRYNLQLAFDTAEKYGGIDPLLEVDDIIRMATPDWKCVFTYVQNIYRALTLPRRVIPPRHLAALPKLKE